MTEKIDSNEIELEEKQEELSEENDNKKKRRKKKRADSGRAFSVQQSFLL